MLFIVRVVASRIEKDGWTRTHYHNHFLSFLAGQKLSRGISRSSIRTPFLSKGSKQGDILLMEEARRTRTHYHNHFLSFLVDQKLSRSISILMVLLEGNFFHRERLVDKNTLPQPFSLFSCRLEAVQRHIKKEYKDTFLVLWF